MRRLLSYVGYRLGCLLSGFVTVLCAAYLLRVPLLTGIGVIVLYYFSLLTPARRILRNGFDLDGFWDLVYVYLAAFLLGLVIMVTGRVVQLHGIERFFGAYLMPDDPYARWLNRLYYLLLPIIVVVVVVGAVVGATVTSEALGWPSALLAGAVGLLLFLLLVFIVHGAQILFTRKKVLDRSPSDVLLPTSGGLKPLRDRDPAGKLIRWPPIAWLVERLQRIARLLLPENVGRGYFEYRLDGTILWVRRGHLTALILFALTLVLYLWFGGSDFRRLTSGLSPLVPTLCYVLLLATLLCWGLSMAAFFLDRYRIPVFVLLVAILLATSFAPWLNSDHYYPVRTPVPVSEDTKKSSDERIVVVAATGGGIQSAAWTARVLTGLEEECREKGCSQSFDESIRVISAASGGSVGAMYFVNEYQNGALPGEGLENIVRRTERSSLDYIVWGLLYPDLVRLINITPFDPEWLSWDRGRALQLAWLRKDMEWDNRSGIQQSLSRWRNDASAGDRPAVIFNTTVAETGQRLPLTTTVPLGRSQQYAGIFQDETTSTDLSVVTAARLSATFPYVSPAARANVKGLAPHLVDGGYYDNYGVVSLVEWLDEELERNHDIDEVLVVEIRGAGGPCTAEEAEETAQIEKKRGWFFQALAPLLTVLNVRGPAQYQNNKTALDLLIEKWDEKGEETDKKHPQEDEVGEHRVEITRAVFQFDGTDPPTQWHLSPGQKRDIQTYWDAETTGQCNIDKGWGEVAAFLGTEAGPGLAGEKGEAAQVPKDWPVGPLNIAHRGGRYLAPENTLVGFEEGLVRAEADVLEFDVHPTKDGELVVIHDDDVDRTTDGAGPVRDMTLEEIKRLDAGYDFPAEDSEVHPYRGQGITIPTLGEVYRRFPTTPVNIEIKEAAPGIEEDVWREIKRARAAKRTLVASQKTDVLRRFREVSRGRVATGASREELVAFTFLSHIYPSLLLQTPYQALQAPKELVTPAFVRVAHESHHRVDVWTVNEKGDMRRLLGYGVDGVMTDRPDILNRVLQERGDE